MSEVAVISQKVAGKADFAKVWQEACEAYGKAYDEVVCQQWVVGDAIGLSDQIDYSKKDLFCMAKNIYHEAGHEPKLGKYAVAQVTINRMESPLFGDRVCEVVFEPRQFSWANYHGRRWTTPSGPAWNEAKRIAHDVLENNKRIKGMDDALFYHATYVRPYWARTKDRLTRIGLHIFYEQA